jgi:DNA-binding transcriptional ArsR family regulator
VTPGAGIDPERDELIESLRDPIRRRLLFVLDERSRGATIRQLALRLKEPARRIRHYVEILAETGQVVVERERPSRGTIERTFRAAGSLPLLWREDWPGLGITDTKMVLLDILRLTFDNVTEAIAEGTFAERQGWCAARSWGEVDAQGWQELAEIHEKATLEVVAAFEQAAERLSDGQEGAFPVVSALFFFEALPWQE